MPHAVIIGHTGQDGRILRDQLLERGYTVTGASRSQVLRGGDVSGALDFTNPAVALEFIRLESPDEIYVLAARHHSSQEREEDPWLAWETSWRVHVQVLVSLLEAVSHECPSTGVFYASSSRVFGQASSDFQDESTPLRPECVYGVTKAAGMLAANQYRVAHGLRVCCGIMYNHESPLRGAAFISQRVVEGLAAIAVGRGGPITIGDMGARVDWGYAPDYTRAMQAMLAYPDAMDYVVATGITHSVADLVRIAAERLDLDWRACVAESSTVLSRKPQRLCGNSERLRRNTGWAPSIDFSRMVELMVDAAVARQRV